MKNISSQRSQSELLLVPVTVHVPRGTEAAFRNLAEALSDAVDTPVSRPVETPACETTHSSEALLTAATDWWKLLNRNERAIWSLWIESAPELVPASRIVSELKLKSSNSIKGVINRMVSKGDKVGFQVGWQSSRFDPITGEKLYGVRDFGTGEITYDRLRMTGVEYARLLQTAKQAAEGTR